jgi:enoyl-CoA hydratase
MEADVARADADAAAPEFLRVESPAPAVAGEGPFEQVALVTLNRPDVLNALNYQLLGELAATLETLDADDECHAVVITGAGERAFAAGADIKEMADQSPVSLTRKNHFARWERIKRIRTPLIAAVRGYALGGGCELAMACDMIVAADDAMFGQPEIRIGVMPGAGGTQRLTRAIGKARAMELILTGDQLPAREAAALGLVTRVVPPEETLLAALRLAARIAALPPIAVLAAKESVNRAFELSLEAGLEFERRNFFLLFASDDQKEGMSAFIEKRQPRWEGR